MNYKLTLYFHSNKDERFKKASSMRCHNEYAKTIAYVLNEALEKCHIDPNCYAIFDEKCLTNSDRCDTSQKTKTDKNTKYRLCVHPTEKNWPSTAF